MWMTILIVVLVVALLGRGFGHRRYRFLGWSPAAIIPFAAEGDRRAP